MTELDRECFGNFDSLETAKLASTIYLPWLQSAGKPFSQIDKSGDRIVSELEANLPPFPNSAGAGWELQKAIFLYKVRMNAIGNSYGKYLLSTVPSNQKIVELAIELSTRREILRAVFASIAYLARTHHYPNSLHDLVMTGLVKHDPWDFYAAQPLKLNTVKRVIYSVGPDGKDDGGIIQHLPGEIGKDVGDRIAQR